MTTSTQGPSSRIASLDGIRGLASTVVVFSHLRMATNLEMPVWYLRPFFSGESSVVMFFVLSGYILSIPFWKGKEPPYGTYLLRRFIRIYLPYAAAVLLAFFIGSHFAFSVTGLTSWFNRTWQTPFTLDLLLQQLSWVSTRGELNPAFWSLRYEIEMSLVLPFLCIALAKFRFWPALLLLCIARRMCISLLAYNPPGLLRESLISLSWAACFLLGALLAREIPTILHRYRLLPSLAKVAIVIFSLLPLFIWNELMSPFGACALIVVAEEGRGYKFFTHPILEYLGKVSYSMYLVHGTVLWLVMIVTVHRIPMLSTKVMALVAILIASHLFYFMVEEQTIRLGRYIRRGLYTQALPSSLP